MWWKDAVFYETYVDKFAGNFNQFANRLDYLKKLGIDCIHILPHYPSPMIDDGYDVSDYMNVREDLGTLENFDFFISEAKRMGIRIMIDLVLNHVSTIHPWFLEAKSTATNKKRNFFLWSKTGTEFKDAENPFIDLKPRNWIYDETTGEYFFSTFYPEQADLNWDNAEVFSEMMKVIDFWASRGVDGFRLDAVSHLIKREGTNSKCLPETHRVIKNIRAYLDRRWPNRALLAEVHESMDKVREFFGNGDEAHLVYNFPLAEKIFLSLLRNDREAILPVLEASTGIPANCQWATFLRNHDELSLATLDEHEYYEFIRAYDPEEKNIFGRGVSLRVADLCSGDKTKIVSAFQTLFNCSGSPIIYYGDEIGMKNLPLLEEADNRRAGRGPFDWSLALKCAADPDSVLSKISELVKTRKTIPSRLIEEKEKIST
ncbi:trehalose synthase [Candidatus Giovannonibacteria bacterium]|nr:trehalose synthase [Candidatus Giovannonibacteria bacterium]